MKSVYRTNRGELAMFVTPEVAVGDRFILTPNKRQAVARGMEDPVNVSVLANKQQDVERLWDLFATYTGLGVGVTVYHEFVGFLEDVDVAGTRAVHRKLRLQVPLIYVAGKDRP